MTEPRRSAPVRTPDGALAYDYDAHRWVPEPATKPAKDDPAELAASRERRLYEAMLAAGIDDPLEQSSFLATMAHETQGFTKFEEDGYRPERVWELRKGPLSARGVTLEELQRAAATDGREAMDEYMYADAYRSQKYRLGNDRPGDGARYAGGGYVQLTGKDGYRRMGRKIGVDLEANPELARDPEIAARIAVEFWKEKGIGEAARAGDLRKVRELVNGGDRGLDDFRKRQELYLARGLQRLEVDRARAEVKKPAPVRPTTPATRPATRPAPIGPAPVPMGTYNAMDRRRG